jgi:hypothetical protein
MKYFYTTAERSLEINVDRGRYITFLRYRIMLLHCWEALLVLLFIVLSILVPLSLLTVIALTFRSALLFIFVIAVSLSFIFQLIQFPRFQKTRYPIFSSTFEQHRTRYNVIAITLCYNIRYQLRFSTEEKSYCFKKLSLLVYWRCYHPEVIALSKF